MDCRLWDHTESDTTEATQQQLQQQCNDTLPIFLLLPIVNPSPSAWKGFPGSLAGKESTCNAGDPGLIPWWRRSPGEGLLGKIPSIYIGR